MPEHYDDIRSMIKSKSDRAHTRDLKGEADRFDKLMKMNYAMDSGGSQIATMSLEDLENSGKMDEFVGYLNDRLSSPVRDYADLEQLFSTRGDYMAKLFGDFMRNASQGAIAPQAAPKIAPQYTDMDKLEAGDELQEAQGRPIQGQYQVDDNGKYTESIALSAKNDEKSDKSEEDSEEKGEKEPKSEEKEPKSDSEPPKSDSEEAQDDEPAPEMPETGDFGSEIDSSELKEILAEIAEKLGEGVAQEIRGIMMEHLDDETLDEGMDANEGMESAPEEPKMEPFDGGATVIMGVEGADEPEPEPEPEPEEGYVSIRECISTRKSGDKHTVYNREVQTFRKLYGGDYQVSDWNDTNPEFAPAMGGPETPAKTADTRGLGGKGTPSGEGDTPKPKKEKKDTPVEDKPSATDAKNPATETQTPEPKPETPEPKPETPEPNTGAGQQTAARQPLAVGSGNTYYSLFGPRLNGQPGLLSRLAQAYRNWRLNRAKAKQAGQPAAAAAGPAPAATGPAPAAGAQTKP